MSDKFFPVYDDIALAAAAYLGDSDQVDFHEGSTFSDGCVAIQKAFEDGAKWATSAG